MFRCRIIARIRCNNTGSHQEIWQEEVEKEMTTDYHYWCKKTRKEITSDNVVMDEKRGLVCTCHDLVVLKYPPKPKKNNDYEYHLSRNDLDEIRHFSKGVEISSLAKKALTIISYLEGGLHHVSSTQKEQFDYKATNDFVYKRFGSMATYDASHLTTLVILAHELAVRIEVSSLGFKYWKISFYERSKTGQRMYERHPSIDEVIKNWRKR